jgi:hypothetical protein
MAKKHTSEKIVLREKKNIKQGTEPTENCT